MTVKYVIQSAMLLEQPETLFLTMRQLTARPSVCQSSLVAPCYNICTEFT